MQDQEMKIPLPDVMLILLRQLNATAYEKECILQCEESGSRVAYLQGYLRGVRAYKSTLRRSGYTFDAKYDGTQERSDPIFDDDRCELDLDELRVLVSDIDRMAHSTDFQNFKTVWQDAVDAQKDWLFYTSEKGRDLHFSKGWYQAMIETDTNITKLFNELELAEKEAAESLPFDGDRA